MSNPFACNSWIGLSKVLLYLEFMRSLLMDGGFECRPSMVICELVKYCHLFVSFCGGAFQNLLRSSSPVVLRSSAILLFCFSWILFFQIHWHIPKRLFSGQRFDRGIWLVGCGFHHRRFDRVFLMEIAYWNQRLKIALGWVLYFLDSIQSRALIFTFCGRCFLVTESFLNSYPVGFLGYRCWYCFRISCAPWFRSISLFLSHSCVSDWPVLSPFCCGTQWIRVSAIG